MCSEMVNKSHWAFATFQEASSKCKALRERGERQLAYHLKCIFPLNPLLS